MERHASRTSGWYAQAILVKTGAGKETLETYRHKWKNVEPVYIAENILDAIHWLLQFNL